MLFEKYYEKWSLDQILDKIEDDISSDKTILNTLIKKFKGGDYSVSSYIKEYQEHIQSLDKIWDIINDDDHEEYFTPGKNITYHGDIYVEDKKEYEIDIPSYDGNKWVPAKKLMILPTYRSIIPAYNEVSIDSGRDANDEINAIIKERKRIINDTVEEYNRCITRICKTCNEPFTISQSEKEWYEYKNLKLPTHCRSCCIERDRIKNNKEV